MSFDVAVRHSLRVAETLKPPLAPRFCAYLRSLHEVTLAYDAKEPIAGRGDGNAADAMLRH